MERIAKLTNSQKGIYLSCLTPTLAYNLPLLLKLDENITILDLTNALKKIFVSHPTINTTIFLKDGEIYQSYNDDEPEIKIFEVDTLEKEKLVRPFELTNNKLYRIEFYKTLDGIYFFFDIHHIIFDGFSITKFFEEIIKIIDNEPIEFETYSLFDYSLDEERLSSDETMMKKAKEYYEKIIANPDVDSNLIDDKKDDEISYRRFRYDFSKFLNADIKKVLNKYSISRTAFFNSVFSYALSVFTNDDEVLYVSVNNGRNEKTKNDFGMFVKTFPIYFNFSKYSDLATIFISMDNEIKENVDNSIYSFIDIAKDLEIKNDILFSYQGEHYYSFNFKNKTYDIEVIETKDGKSNIAIELFKDKDRYFANIEYRSDMYEFDYIYHFLFMFEFYINEFLNKDNLEDINKIDEKEELLLDSFNNQDLSMFDQNYLLLDMFSDKVKKFGDKICIETNKESYTFLEVDNLSNKIANHIIKNGYKKNDVASILIHRNAYMLIASLGVLKAGLVYQPLDATYPKERLNFMVKDASSTLLITERDLRDTLDEYNDKILYLDEIPSLEDLSSKLPKINKDDRFVLLYTSGSTGVPKGVELSHGNISMFIQNFKLKHDVKEDERWSAYASYGFDANMFDMYCSTCLGCSLFVIDEDMRLDLKRMNAYFIEKGITSAFMTTQVARQFATDYQNSSLKRLVLGGEKLVPLTPPKFDMINAYGPTETTICVTDQLVDNVYHRIPIGKGYKTVNLYVLDKNKNRLPFGACGELYISGPQVALGYLNREEQNKISFIKNPFAKNKDFERMYKTGDIVRFLNDGRIDFIGRKDGQVKIRGFRIELTEVEAIIRKYKGIKDATVNSYDAKIGGNYIAAFIASDEKINIDDLKDFIAKNKPPYMVPEVIMQIDKIPLNQNGKVNRKALPKVERKIENIVKPRNDNEQALYDILKDILGYDNFGIKEDIFYLGLTSIASIKLITLISEKLNKDISIKELHDAKNIESIAILLAKDRENIHFDRQDDYPISKTQEGIFVESISKKDSTIYNIPLIYELSKNIDINRLENALRKAIDNHPYLKGRLFLNDDGDIRIIRHDDEEVHIEICDFDGELKDIKIEPFDLLKDELYRVKIFVKKDVIYLLIDTHHIVSDGTSLAILIDDINKAYLGKEIEGETLDGFDYALLEKRMSTSEEIEEEKKYYYDIFNGLDTNSTPRKDYYLSKEANLKTYDYKLNIDDKKLEQFIINNHLSNNILFNAIFSFALAKFNGSEDSLYTTIYSGRDSLKLSRSICMLVKTIPVYAKFEKDEKIIDYINKLKNQITSSQENTLYSFSDISKDLKLKADVMFAYQGDGFINNEFLNEKAKKILIDSSEAKSIFSVDVTSKNNSTYLHFEYRNDYYLLDTMKYFSFLFNKIANEFIEKEYLKEVEFVDEEISKQMDKYNDTDDELAKNKTHVDLFVEEVNLHPDKLAVIAIDKSLTYKELHKASNKVANVLIKEGVKSDDKIILMLPRIAHAYSATQGVLKSSGAYVPLDPAYPNERIAYIIEDSEAKILITTKDLYLSKAKDYQIKTLILEDILKNGDSTYHKQTISPTSLAYVIYTSGSTGKPKGVMIEHHSLYNYVAHSPHNIIAKEYKDMCSVSVSLASLSFDLSVQEQMVPLANGLSVVLASEDEILNPLLLVQRMNKYHVDFITTTPSYVNNVLDIDEVVDAFKNIKVLDIGAEALPVSLLRKMKEKGLTWEIHNGYGPTEATVACTMDIVNINEERITIGYPFSNYKAYIIDSNNKRLPFGAVGELLIAGEGVARGYVNRLDLTKEKFITFNSYRAYKTGDMARINYDGKIEFFGRMDNQVKLRGLRVELDEIENQINKYNGITRSVVLVKETPQDGQFLVAYVTASKEIDFEDVKKEIGKSLTPYMIPKVFMKLDSIPLTSNGKVDKKSLPEVEIKASKSKSNKPKNKNQEILYNIFKKVLGVNDLSIEDDFFDLGGTSLSASKITMLAMKEGLNISYSDVFDYPSVISLDAYLRANNKVDKDDNNGIKVDEIRPSLIHNSIAEINDIDDSFKYHNVLLLGGTGFLGVHILKELIDKDDINIVLVVRKGNADSVTSRVKGILAYYFDNPYEECFENKIKVIEGDVTDNDLYEKIKDLDIDLILNSAAIVKHFAKDDIIERINYGGVVNLINIAKKLKIRLIQISTLSVAGENVNNKFLETKRIHENECYFGQDISNKYINSKIKAEEAILDSVEKDGLDAKIVRVGNLMGRFKDGEFQINALTNNFMNSLKAYKALGLFPIDMADETIDFSPIDEVAKTILLFASTNKKYTIFHSANSHEVEMGNVITAMNEYGFKIDMVSQKEFIDKLNEFILDENKNGSVSSLLNYENSDKSRVASFILSDNKFSIKTLYRLNYKWPIINEDYIKKMIEALATLGYFEL